MSRYTTELRFICERFAGLEHSTGYMNISQVLENCWDKIFDFDFPIFDESYRKVLCIKILRHFYTREIGMETYGLWKLRLEDRMNVIMPYYNKLYSVWQQEFNPLNEVDLTRKHILDKNETTTGDGQTETQAENTNRDLYSDTPQGSLQNVENETYLTSARKNIDNANSNTSNTFNQQVNSTDNYIEQLTGIQSGGYSKALSDFKNALINIDDMVIGELNNLFMLIW